jgi:hypothetical protein
MKPVFLVIATLFSVAVSAQALIAVQNGSTATFYNNLDSAIIHAQNDDTLYLPGGIFPLSTSTKINKRLHIIGVGHNPDSTIATSKTIINGDIYLLSNASGGSICGISLEPMPPNTSGSIYFGDVDWVTSIITSAVISDFLIERCFLKYCFFIAAFEIPARYSNNTIRENTINLDLRPTGYPSEIQSNLITNNIIGSITGMGINNNILNNIVFDRISGDGCIINNNIFLGGSFTFSGVTNSLINNNLWVTDTPIPATNYGTNNLINVSPMFVNQSGSTFSYSNDYHLQATSPGKNAGIDGTDIGNYGGAFPWEEGSVPSNPHIYFKQIAPQTNSNGQLQIQIKVRTNN